MDEQLLTLLQMNARASATDLADLLGTTEADVAARVAAFEKAGVILGYQAVLDPEKVGDGDLVTAFIEVRLSPERDGGFNRLAERIAKFDQVASCYLMSGGYDLMVIVHGSTLRSVAQFISEKLSTLQGVLSTATHFHLKTYKQAGFLAHSVTEGERLPVAP